MMTATVVALVVTFLFGLVTVQTPGFENISFKLMGGSAATTFAVCLIGAIIYM